METIYDELYIFLAKEEPEEIKMFCFKDWLKWYIDNDLYHIERDQDNKISKVVFIRKLNSNDIVNFPEYLHPDINLIDDVAKFYIHRPEGNVYYCELLVDSKEDIDDFKLENMKFAFSWAIEKFDIKDVQPSEILLYYKKGNKVKMYLKDIENILARYRK